MALNRDFYTLQADYTKTIFLTARLQDADTGTYPTGHGDLSITWGTATASSLTGMEIVANDLVFSVPAGALLNKVEFYNGGALMGSVSTTAFVYSGAGTYTLKDLTVTIDNA